MQNEVFQNIMSWDELKHLMSITDKPIIISMKKADTIQQLPILQNYTPKTLNILPTNTLSYNALYYQIQCVGHCAGLPDTRIVITKKVTIF
jgi:hypothetical protein